MILTYILTNNKFVRCINWPVDIVYRDHDSETLTTTFNSVFKKYIMLVRYLFTNINLS